MRNKDQFQGARFELCVTACLIVAGFEIDYEDEGDTLRKHAEFIAKDSSGQMFAVEAKSRHREDVLDYKSGHWQSGNKRESNHRPQVENILRKALAKEPANPYLVFIDVNLPHNNELAEGNPWFTEITDTVKKISAEPFERGFPANAIFFCNDPTHQMLDEIPPGKNFWCYGMPIEKAARPLRDVGTLTRDIVQATWRRTNFPNEFPAEDR